MHPLITAAAAVLAAPSPAPGTGTGINTNGILGWLASVLLPILIAGAGVFIVCLASGGKLSRVVSVAGIVILGVIFFGSAGVLALFGTDIVHVIFG